MSETSAPETVATTVATRRRRPRREPIALAPWRRTVRGIARFATVTDFSAMNLRIAVAVLALLAFLLWRSGWFWAGTVAAFAVMLLEASARTLSRESGKPDAIWEPRLAWLMRWLVPPLWWSAWLLGLSQSELAFEPVYGLLVFAAILFGHVTLLVIARIFVARFGIALSAWRPFDSRFRRIAAGRDNDLAIVLLSLLFARPDRGIELVALWTLCTLVVQATRLAMANDRRSHKRPVVSWLA